MPNKENDNFDNSESKEVIHWLTQSGLIVDKSIKDKDIAAAQAHRQKKLFHNTQQLLENYRDINWILKSYPEEIAAELREPVGNLDSLIDRVSYDLDIEESEYIGRLNSINKSRQLLKIVDRALTALKNKPNGGNRMYYIIYYTYIYGDKKPLTQEVIDMIMYDEHSNDALAERTYYYLRKKAINILSIFLWSSPNKILENWINVTILLNKETNKL